MEPGAILRGLGLLVLLYLALMIGLFAFQRRLLYHPGQDRGTPAAAGAPELSETTVTTADGLTLAGWWKPPAAPGRPTVVLFHGNAGTVANAAWKARPWLDAGWGVWLAEYRGFGGNPGSPSEQGLLTDARAVLDRLKVEGIPAGQTILYGESLGSGVAVAMAAEREVAGVVLEAPYTSIPDVAVLTYWYVPVRLLTLDTFDSLRRIARVKAPLLVLHGDRDGVVPVRFGLRLYEAANQPKTLFRAPEANHVDLYDWGAWTVVERFIHRLGVRSEAG